MAPRFINPPTISKPPGYTHVVETTGPGRTIYIAGQLGIDPAGKMAADFRGQTVQAFFRFSNACTVWPRKSAAIFPEGSMPSCPAM